MAVVLHQNGINPKELPFSIARVLQQKHEVCVDALPYIDKEYDDDEIKDAVDRLVEEEMETFQPDDYLATLPPVPSVSFAEGSLLRNEYDRVAANPNSKLPPLDMSRYEITIPQGAAAEKLANWQEALKTAEQQQQYAAIRLENAELMQQYGVNAWRAYNSALEDNNALLQKEMDRLDAQVLEINRKRYMEQTQAGIKVQRLEDKYAALRDKNLRLAYLCEQLESTFS